MTKGLNMQLVKSENRTLLLYLLNREGAMSRKELATRLGLTPAAVTKICTGLLADGLICESGESYEEGKSGRREILLSLRLQDKAVFGINAESDVITFSASTLDGKVLRLVQIPFTAVLEDVLAKAVALETAWGGTNAFIGAGICVIGSPEDDDFGIWKDNDLQARFEAALGLPAAVENNVKAFVQSELIYGIKQDVSSVLFLKWGPGIGSAIAANGKVFSGSDSSVAEIGHYIVNPGGTACRCGRFGCLETEAGEKAIRRELNSQKPLDELIKNCDNEVMNIIDHKIDMVALAVTNTATILSTDNIVFFGSMFKNEIIAEKLKKQCMRYNANLSGEGIVRSPLNDKSSYIGCTAICARRFFFEQDGR